MLGMAGGRIVEPQLAGSGDGMLMHFGARFCEPVTARWTEVDPLTQITDSQEANRYVYAGGDPVSNTSLKAPVLSTLEMIEPRRSPIMG
jgi:RHS repeat-associated protein